MDVYVMVFLGLPLDLLVGMGVSISSSSDLGSTFFPVLGTFLGLVVFLGLFLTPFTTAGENEIGLSRTPKQIL